jgi:uncharacterized protein YkwD
MTLRQRAQVKKDRVPKNRPRFFSFLLGKKVATQEAPAFETLGGVFSTFECSLDKSFGSFSTAHTLPSNDANDESSSTTSSKNHWVSSGSKLHHKGAPLVVRIPPSQRFLGYTYPADDNGVDDAAATLGLVMMRSRRLPQHSDSFASNHVMINADRVRRLIQPLVRLTSLDQLAREHASAMASVGHLFHTDMNALKTSIGKKTTHRLGLNVVRGASVQSMHNAMMAKLPDKNNILDRRFTCMGMGTAKSEGGTLYLCQIFRG